VTGIKHYQNGIELQLLNSQNVLTSNNISNVNPVKLFSNGNTYQVNKLIRIRAWKSVQPITLPNDADYFDYIFNHGQLSKTFDLVGNNDVTWNNVNLITFWGSELDGIEPYELTKGATLYQNNSNQTIMPICKDTSEVISGFTRLGYFPAGSGILKGLSNTYNIPVDADINAVVSAGDKTFADIDALVPSDELKITKTTNNISRMIVRKKQ